MRLIPNMELRQVPLDWEHPTDEKGDYVPLLPRSALDATYTEEDLAELAAAGEERTREEACMPDFSDVPAERMGLRVYHTVNEGEPATPAFPDTSEGREELITYTAEQVTKFGKPVGREIAQALFAATPTAAELIREFYEDPS